MSSYTSREKSILNQDLNLGTMVLQFHFQAVRDVLVCPLHLRTDNDRHSGE